MPIFCAICAAALVGGAVHAEAAASPYDQAVLARQSGRPNEAARLLEQLLSVRPDDVDARLQYGYALLDLGRLGEAEGAFHLVLKQAPAYADARIGLARVAQRRGRLSQARAWLRPIPNGNAEAAALRDQLANFAASRWQVDAGASVSAVGRGQPDWREFAGQLRFRPTEQLSLAGRVEATRRFGIRDVYSEAQVGRRFSPTLSAYLLAGGTPRADHRPSWLLGGGLTARVRPGANPTILTFDARYARYMSGEIATLQPGAEQYLLNGKAWATGRIIALVEGGTVHAGALGRLDVQATPALRLFAGSANAPDTSEGMVTRVFSLFGGLEAALSPDHSLRVSLARTDQEAGADRMEVAAGFAVRF